MPDNLAFIVQYHVDKNIKHISKPLTFGFCGIFVRISMRWRNKIKANRT